MTATQMAGASTDWVEPVFDAFSNPTKAGAALEALDGVSAEESINPRVEFMVRALLVDLDGAMGIAERLVEPGEVFEMDMLFIPQLRALRKHPDFMPLLDKLGITRYWQSEGCVWDGDQVTC